VERLKYPVHAYAWTSSWSNETRNLIDRAMQLGFNMIEIPLMEVELVNPHAIKQRLSAVGLGVCTSTVLPESADITGEDQDTRRRGGDYLKRCINVTAETRASIGSTYMWRKLADYSDQLLTDGLPYPKGLEAKYCR